MIYTDANTFYFHLCIIIASQVYSNKIWGLIDLQFHQECFVWSLVEIGPLDLQMKTLWTVYKHKVVWPDSTLTDVQ